MDAKATNRDIPEPVIVSYTNAIDDGGAFAGNDVCIYLIYMAHAAVWAEAGIGHLDPPEAYRSKFRACYLQLHVPHMIG